MEVQLKRLQLLARETLQASVAPALNAFHHCKAPNKAKAGVQWQNAPDVASLPTLCLRAAGAKYDMRPKRECQAPHQLH